MSLTTIGAEVNPYSPTVQQHSRHLTSGVKVILYAKHLISLISFSGNTSEPYLTACARPDYLLPAYNQGRNLAESYYLSLVYLSWQSVIVGDPLCSIGKP